MRHDQPKPDQPDPDCQQASRRNISLGESSQQSLIEQDMLSRRRALSYLIAQLVLSLTVTALLLLYDPVTAYSALTGGMIATVSNAWFTYRVFRVSATSAASAMLTSVYVGEIYKILLTGALFVCAFVLIKPVDALALFVSYFLIHMTPLLVNVFDRNDEDIRYRKPDQ